jgi:hypothetical protein
MRPERVQKTVTINKNGVREVEIIQFKELYANRRTDEDFLTYSSDKMDNSEDNHCSDVINPSPFLLNGYGVLTGFVLESMHTLDHGAFGRAMVGLACEKKEGKLDTLSLRKVDHRIALFQQCKPYEFERKLRILSRNAKSLKHHELRSMLMYYLYPTFKGILESSQLENVMLLQHLKLLLGGFEPIPVPHEDLEEAEKVARKYNSNLMAKKIPIRSMNHAIIHIADDCRKFKVQSESLSAYIFENFMRFFRNVFTSGYMPLEQLTNRLFERYKYRLNTAEDGSILSTKEDFDLEVKKWPIS